MAMDKAKTKIEIEKRQQAIIDDMITSRNRMKAAADIDENETTDPEDLSRQNELGTMATRLKFMLQKANDDMTTLMDLPLDTGDAIMEGSMVVTERFVFYVGIAVHPFDLEGARVVSISTDAPIYVAMRGKKTGDTFELSGQACEILEVQ